MKVELNNNEKENLRRQQAIEVLRENLSIYIQGVAENWTDENAVRDLGRQFIEGIFEEIENRS
jgi:hypothetical protein